MRIVGLSVVLIVIFGLMLVGLLVGIVIWGSVMLVF